MADEPVDPEEEVAEESGASDDEDALVEMEVRGLMIDPSSNHPIVILRVPGEETFLPIWIGLFEASAIQSAIEETESDRPMTHDLFVDALEALTARIERIVVHALEGNTFYARLELLRADGTSVRVDSRPSDGLALALRQNAPVFVARNVLESARQEGKTKSGKEAEDLLGELGDDDFGKYTM